MRLIDADRLLTDRMKRTYYHLKNGDTAIPIIDIEHAPTVETERKVGRWTIEAIDITNDDGRRSYGFYRCSVCKCVSAPSLFVPSKKWLKYCPNCGAKMNEIT